jgi:aubergine-like protein
MNLIAFYDSSQMQMDRTSNYVDAIRNECRQKGFSLIFCVLRSARADTYSSIKKLTCAEFGIPSQVLFLFFFGGGGGGYHK